MKTIFICIPLVILLASPYIAQVVTDRTDRNIVKFPKPKLPPEAKSTGLGGRVNLLVEIDDSGKVTAVRDVQGPDWVCPAAERPDVFALREAAKAAALKIAFEAVSSTSGPLSTVSWISIDFPRPEIKGAKGKDQVFTVATKPEQSNLGNSQSTSEKVTVKGDRNYSAENAPPPDYTGPVNAQAEHSGGAPPLAPKQISGGVLNGKAQTLAKPPYPPAARAVRAAGAVSIQVLIDEAGKIFSAVPVSGHPLLRSAARLAACRSEFSPTYLMGKPVRVSGVIVYNFVP